MDIKISSTNLGLTIGPLRNGNQSTVLGYDTTSNEITYYPTPTPGLTVETVTNTTDLNPNINISIVSGSSHTLPVSSIQGTVKTIVNNNPNVYSKIINSLYKTSAIPTVNIRVLKFDSTLNRMYIGGNFTNLNNVTGASGFCYYDFAMSNFVSLGSVTGGDVYDILIDGTNVYITGGFTGISNSNITANRIAYYNTNNNTWNAMRSGLASSYGAKLIKYNSNIYVCGSFSSAGGIINTAKIAMWNISNSSWNAMGSGITTGTIVRGFALFGSKLWCCGDFLNASGLTNTQYLACWNISNSSWNGYSTNLYNLEIKEILNIGGDDMLVAGSYTSIGSTYTPYTTIINQNTFAISQKGISNNSCVGLYKDNDGIIWYFGQGTLASSDVGYEKDYYPLTNSLAFFNSSTGVWVPTSAGQIGITCMEQTNVPGEYWIGGSFNVFDAVSGYGSLCKFNKNNITTINSTLISSGQSIRHNFNLYYNGQTVNLVNYDNTNWALTNIVSPNTAPSLILY